MKASGSTKLMLIAGVCVLHLILALMFYFVLLPELTPNSAEIPHPFLDDMYVNFAVLAFVGGLAVSLLGLVAAFRLGRNGNNLNQVADAMLQPLLVVDYDNRYTLINTEAERVMRLSHTRDHGQVLNSEVKRALAAAAPGGEDFNIDACVDFGGETYQVFDNPLPESYTGKAARRRIITLRNVTAQMRIRDAVFDINKAMTVLNANTMKISGSALSLSQGATEQASSLATISSSLDEFSKKVQGSTETAAKSTQLAAQAREAAERSGAEIAHALSAMTEVQDAGVRIARIVKLIDEIAFQTNLLALNAAVEAARAGRQGKGFAVVAGEVRNLAGRSAKAAKDTAGMVEDVTERIGNASDYISKLEEMLHNIVQDAIRMADSSASASATSAEQANAILQVNSELGQMNSLTQNTMSEAEQTATAVEVLARQVETLKLKLDSLAVEFSLDLQEHVPASINLTDELGDLPPLSRSDTSKFIDRLFAGVPDKKVAGKLDLGGDYRDAASRSTGEHDPDYSTDEAEEEFSDEEADDYIERYRNFLNSGHSPISPGGPGEFRITSEGDRITKPGQSIQLDDSEFGRY